MAGSKVVTDLTEQARKIGRQSEEETFIFDSTGTGLQDVAAAIAAYQGAVKQHIGTSWSLT